VVMGRVRKRRIRWVFGVVMFGRILWFLSIDGVGNFHCGHSILPLKKEQRDLARGELCLISATVM